MASRLVVAALARNEADRFWRSALEAWSQFADRVLVQDDGSEDETVDIALSARAAVLSSPDPHEGMWGKEAPMRAQLWQKAWEFTRPGDYILVLDADMVPARDPRPLLASEPDAVAFNLYDLWTPDAYRIDGYWQGHNNWRTWCVRRPETPAEGWVWPSRGIHCGHFPSNLKPGRVVSAPRDFGLLHYAYSSPELRRLKHEAYMSVAGQLSDFERAHAASILSEPTLANLPFTPDYTLRLASDA